MKQKDKLVIEFYTGDLHYTWEHLFGEDVRRINEVCRITAEGEDLELIRKMFPFLVPSPESLGEKKRAHFYGDIARTILLNLNENF